MRKVISFTRPRPLFTFTVQMFPGSWFLAPDPRSWYIQFPWICLPFPGYVHGPGTAYVHVHAHTIYILNTIGIR